MGTCGARSLKRMFSKIHLVRIRVPGSNYGHDRSFKMLGRAVKPREMGWLVYGSSLR